MARPTSFRLSEELLERLEQAAREGGESTTALVATLLDEGLKTNDFPGIVYRAGPAGRRAGIVGGPDVWEIVRDIRGAPGVGQERLELVVEETGVPMVQLLLAVNFYTAHPDEIDRRIELDERTAEEVRRAIDLREQLLNS
jgi:hypothetical protein